MQFLPLAVLLLGMPLIILATLSFDALVRAQLERHRESWVADGQPVTILQRHEQCSYGLRNWLATHRCLFVWLFVTPTWVRGDGEATRHLRRMRTCAAAWNLGAMPLFVLSAIAAVVWR